jgi:hypothetical protein
LDVIAKLSASDRADLFRESAARLGIGSAVIIEKDFWVCWALFALFEPEVVPGLVFKGGTSLSKAYGLIRRFSEDIDLTIPLAALGLGEPDPTLSKKAIERLYDSAATECAELLRASVIPSLQSGAAGVLTTGDWSISAVVGDPTTVIFRYPSSLSVSEYGTNSYLAPSVRLEFGVRGGLEPTEQREVEAYCTQALPDAYGRPKVYPRVLAAERTLWEKATICHAEFHRPARMLGLRLSRHYADLAEMAASEVAVRALEQPGLLSAVVENKRRNFPAAYARYEEATPSGIMIVPHDALAVELRRDYDAMSVMFFDQPRPFAEILERLRNFEADVRKLA